MHKQTFPSSADESNLMDAGTPLYQQVRQRILHILSSGEWNQGQALPSEKALCQRFGVSIGTLRKGIDSLVEDHILIRHQGRGTFVSTHNRSSHFFQFFNIAPHDSEKVLPVITLLDFERSGADATCAEKLQLRRGERVIRFRNVLTIVGLPSMIDHICLPASLFPGLDAEMLRNRPSTLYNLYQDSFGQNVIQTDERLRALALPEPSAKVLGVETGKCALEIRRVAYTYEAKPIEWRVSHLLTDAHEYVHSVAQSV